MFYNVNSWSDSEVQVLRRDWLASEGDKVMVQRSSGGTSPSLWEAGEKRLGPELGFAAPKNGNVWLALLRHHKKGRTHGLLKSATHTGHPSQTASFITPIRFMGKEVPGTPSHGAPVYTWAQTELSWELARGWCPVTLRQPGARLLSTPACTAAWEGYVTQGRVLGRFIIGKTKV